MWAALTLLVVLAGALDPRASADAPSSKVQRYTLRAEVTGLPAGPGTFLMLRHEAIDDFVGDSGAVVGMDSMVMPFPVANKVSLDGLAVGDKIEATLVVDWEQPYFELERIQKLPQATVLHFGKARPTASSTPRAETSGEPKQP
jgi:hypothetical protein